MHCWILLGNARLLTALMCIKERAPPSLPSHALSLSLSFFCQPKQFVRNKKGDGEATATVLGLWCQAPCLAGRTKRSARRGEALAGPVHSARPIRPGPAGPVRAFWVGNRRRPFGAYRAQSAVVFPVSLSLAEHYQWARDVWRRPSSSIRHQDGILPAQHADCDANRHKHVFFMAISFKLQLGATHLFALFA